jgi:hypothetical protein
LPRHRHNRSVSRTNNGTRYVLAQLPHEPLTASYDSSNQKYPPHGLAMAARSTGSHRKTIADELLLVSQSPGPNKKLAIFIDFYEMNLLFL